MVRMNEKKRECGECERERERGKVGRLWCLLFLCCSLSREWMSSGYCDDEDRSVAPSTLQFF
jgi:hypothetical protein